MDREREYVIFFHALYDWMWNGFSMGIFFVLNYIPKLDLGKGFMKIEIFTVASVFV